MNSQDQDHPAEGLGYVLDDCYLLHNTGLQHPESPHRLISIQQALESSGAKDRWQRLQPRKASSDELALVHDPVHIERIEEAARLAPSYLDFDTPVSAESYETALQAAGGVLQCVDAVCSDKVRRAFAFIRPPGHHASRERSGGFCLFNNVAVSAAYARKQHKLERVAIVDMDVHHGNGTQSCFYKDPDVLYISSHQYPFYPGSGNNIEAGKGEGKGYTLNFPLPEETDDSNFVPLYSKIIPAVLDQFAPQLILVSAGFDGHFNDPLGGLALTETGYASAASSLMLAAERLCNGRICFVLEGGYNLQALKDCIHATLVEMEKQRPRELSIKEGALFREISKQADRFAAGRWKW
jgi:acetoin utilization deacetylase AcuC-like enzyme